MNTNRNNNNNRRRGRGNNNRGPGGGNGGGPQGNRIDSRARGNAPQLLEKFRKLAHDASLNDDRVQTEYYLQFADHYFRVLADSRVGKDDQRPRREDSDDDGQDYDAPYYDRSQDQRPGGNAANGGNGNSAGNGGRDDRAPAPRNDTRPEPDEGDWSTSGSQQAEADDGDTGENPFVRDARAKGPARERPRRRVGADGERGQSERIQAERAPNDRILGDGLDPGSLPPAIIRGAEGDEGTQEDSADIDGASAKPARAPRAAKPRLPRTRIRAPRPADDGDAESLEAVS